jgi:nitrite reductase (NADH) large subunit
MSERLVVVGGGMVSARFVAELVARAPGRFAVTVIGAEPHAAYNRVLLSSLLAGDIGDDDIALPALPAGADVTVRTGVVVAHVDRGPRRVLLADGRALPYDRLVLATGSSPIRLVKPGMELPGVTAFRDLADTAVLRAFARRGGRAVVIGGGLLGIEASYGLARAGVAVTLVHVMDRLMERQLDAPAAALVLKAVEARGIRVLLGADTARVRGADRVEGLELACGRVLAAQLVVCAVGVRPQTEPARAAGLAVNRGVIVDDELATSDPAIAAIGECAEHRGTVYGLVEPGHEQARTLARRLAGEHAVYPGSVLATNLKVSGVSVFSAGDFTGGTDAEDLLVADPAAGHYRRFVLRDRRLAGAVLVGDTADALWYLELIRAGVDVSALRERLAFGRAFAQPREAA